MLRDPARAGALSDNRPAFFEPGSISCNLKRSIPAKLTGGITS